MNLQLSFEQNIASIIGRKTRIAGKKNRRKKQNRLVPRLNYVKRKKVVWPARLTLGY